MFDTKVKAIKKISRKFYRRETRVNKLFVMAFFKMTKTYITEFKERYNWINISIFACISGLVLIVMSLHVPTQIKAIGDIFTSNHSLWGIISIIVGLLIIKFEVKKLLDFKIVNEIDRILLFSFWLTITLSIRPGNSHFVKSVCILMLTSWIVLTFLRIYTTQSELKSAKKYDSNNNYQHIVLDGPTDIDELKRDAITEDLVATIKEIDFADRVVIGITGLWGSGKSSIWEIAKHELDMQSIIIIDFDPWQMDTKEAILSNLLTAITTNKEINFNLDNSQKIVNAFMGYMLGKVKTPFNALFNVVDNKKVFDNFFDDLSKHLIQMNKHLIITIDNLDRISGDNAFMLVSTINSIGKLKNIVVVLLYDELEMERKFANLAVGQNYMDKLVNKKILVPLADRDSQIELFTNKLIEQFKSKDVKYDTEEIDQFIAKVVEIGGTVRQFNNFVSNLPTNYLPKQDKDKYFKFYLLDLLVIEYIKTTNASAYSELEKNRYMFVELRKMSNDYKKSKFNYLKKFMIEFPAEFKLLQLIIPSVSALSDLNEYSEDVDVDQYIKKISIYVFIPQSSKNHRIFNELYVDWYFNMNALEDVYYEEFISEIVNNDNKKIFEDVISRIAQSDSKSKRVIMSLMANDYKKDIVDDKQKGIEVINSLITHYGDIIKDSVFLERNLSENIAKIIVGVIGKNEEILESVIDERFDEYKNILLLQYIYQTYIDLGTININIKNRITRYVNLKREEIISAKSIGQSFENCHDNDYPSSCFIGVILYLDEIDELSRLQAYYSDYLEENNVYAMLANLINENEGGNLSIREDIAVFMNPELVNSLLENNEPQSYSERKSKELFDKYFEKYLEDMAIY